MFTLGNKEAVINTVAQCVFTPAAATGNVVLNIKGFGTFDPENVLSATARRASAAQLEKIQISIPSSDALGLAHTDVNIPVSFKIKVYTLRHASETAIDFIKKGRPLLLEILVQGDTTATEVATSLRTAITEYQSKFPNVVFPFTAAATVDAYLTLTATEGFYSFGEEVTFTVHRNIIPVTATVTRNFDTGLTISDAHFANGDSTLTLSDITNLAVGDTIQFEAFPLTNYKLTEIVTATKTITVTPLLATATLPVNTNKVYKTQKGVEAIGDGKSMEEGIRMSNIWTTDTYAINPSVVPIIGASYAMVQWTMSAPTTEGGWQGHETPGAVAPTITPQVFTLYFNEAVCLTAAGVVDKLLVWLNAAGAAGNTVVVGDFKKANGASAASEDDFIA
jgi:hypothetical protein